MQKVSRIRRQWPTGLTVAAVLLTLCGCAIFGWKQWRDSKVAARQADATSMLMHGVFNDDPEMIREAAYSSGVKLRPQDKSLALVIAVIESHQKAVAELLRCGAGVNSSTLEGRTPLIVAAGTPGDEQIAEMLLKHGANPAFVDPLGESPLTEARKTGNVEVVKLLLADMGQSNSTQSNKM